MRQQGEGEVRAGQFQFDADSLPEVALACIHQAPSWPEDDPNRLLRDPSDVRRLLQFQDAPDLGVLGMRFLPSERSTKNV